MSNQFNNQRCSKCHQTYSGLRATCYDSSCDREHFFKKNGQLVCIMCLMGEGSIKCQKCSKLMTSLGEMGKWRGNMFSSDGHTYDINNFGCECRECNHSESEKNKLKRCQGTFYVHYKRCCEGEHDSMQFNQCDSAVPIDGGDFCQHCKDQTETYQQVKARIAAEGKRGFEEFKQAYEKAQNYWNSLSSSERERECERIVENIKLGKYWLGKHWVNRDVEGYCSGWAHNSSFWTIKNGKLTSSTPHLPPIELAEEFSKKEFGDEELVLRDYKIVKKDNNENKNNSPSFTPTSPNSQSITNSDDNSDNSVDLVNAPPSNSEPKNLSEIKISLNQTGESSQNESKNNLGEEKETQNEANKDNQKLVINLKDIKKISLVGDDLVIEFNQSEKRQMVVSEQITNNRELSAVKNYLRKNNQTSLSQQELEKIFRENNHSASTKKPPELNNALLIGGGIMVLIIGVGIGLFLRKSKKISKKVN